MDTLEAKLEKPFHIPLPDYNNARKLEETDSPPSELELFFRVIVTSILTTHLLLKNNNNNNNKFIKT